MRTLFTALAFLIILWAVLPAVRRSVSATRQNADSHDKQTTLAVRQACSVAALAGVAMPRSAPWRARWVV